MALNVVVVGAGLIGAAVAADLARGGCAVTVLESNQFAAGTSGATFAWTNAGGKQPRSYFDLNVVENFHFAVTHSGVTLWLRVAELVGAEVRGERVDELTPFRHSRLDA